jgi:DNA-binding response OmpR family regulator
MHQGLNILSVSPDPNARHVRDVFLRAAGYHVLSASSTGHAMSLMVRRECDLMLVCHAVSREDRGHLVAAFKTWHPLSRVLVIGDERERLVDDCLHSSREPADLLPRVSALLSGMTERIPQPACD